MPGVTGTSYTPSTAALGVFYYYVVITNTNLAATKDQLVTITSETAEIKVVTDNVIVINVFDMSEWDLIDQVREVNANTNSTFVVSPPPSGSYVSYQWYLDSGSIGGNTASFTFNRPPGIYQLVVVVRTDTGEDRSGRCRVTAVRQ